MPTFRVSVPALVYCTIDAPSDDPQVLLEKVSEYLYKETHGDDLFDIDPMAGIRVYLEMGNDGLLVKSVDVEGQE